jgi:hypothetical protein
MQEKPYFCPNCRSNRVKFSVVSSSKANIMKDAVTGEIKQMDEPQPIDELEPNIQCLVCSFTGNESRFLKQAEREPRTETSTNPSYT